MISLTAPQAPVQLSVPLASSKSESNRALIIQGLSREKIELHNLSSARDTQTMIRLLESEGHVLDVIDAGTTMRFLTAYFAATGRDQILTGTPRMCKRPIGILVEALRSLGAEIQYWKQEGYPPLHIQSNGQALNGTELEMRGNVSSQFISAILMIAPTLPEGLKLHLAGDISSRPYIELTRAIMAHFGVATHWEGQSIIVPSQAYQAGEYTIESDWSAASYWYSFAALSPQANIHLKGLRETSWQGDHQIAGMMRHFGVESTFDGEGVRLTKSDWQATDQLLEIDFVETPDLAQTIAVVSAALGQPVKMTGLHTLRVKETDRIAAIKEELAKFSLEVEVEGDDAMIIRGKVNEAKPTIHTYDDHRMAMAFAPLVMTQGKLDLDEPDVVKKSYPEFWDHLALAGVKIQEW